MSLTLLIGVVLVLGCAVLATMLRRAELVRMGEQIRLRDRALRSGSQRAQLQHPVIDLGRCMGCATCVVSCPEENVLGLLHGQAAVLNGAGCVGVSACARECPVGAISVTLADLSERRDVPVLQENLEALGVEGLFVAGELTAHALIKTAVEHGTSVAREVQRRPRAEDGGLDLCIIGAGPAGLACALEAKRLGLSFVLLEREPGPGGTVAKYPRKKLVMTQSVELPIHGPLKAGSYTKEELVGLWERLIERHALPVESNQELEYLERDPLGSFQVETKTGRYSARHVCLALGRRGSPVKLGVPGEELSKVSYGLMDARAYSGQELLVVGGGNSAVETALALSKDGTNRVLLSYRKDHFFRLRGQNEQHLEEAQARGNLRVLTASRVRSIHADSVQLEVGDPAAPELVELPNQHVFILAGGTPPFGLLERAGVSFDPSLREAPGASKEEESGLRPALIVALVAALFAIGFALYHRDYYALESAARALHPKHETLSPSHGLGFGFGLLATIFIVVNLTYVLRRSPRVQWQWGSLQAWMSSHVVTGVLAFLFATLHSAMGPEDSAGGHAYLALALLMFTGGVGRYFYALVPRAANGRELALEEAKERLRRLPEDLGGGQRRFYDEARSQALQLVERCQWSSSFIGRLMGLMGLRRDLSRLVSGLIKRGLSLGIPAAEVSLVLQAVRETYRRGLMAAHYEDLRSLMSVWRYVHRWATALMLVLLLGHVFYALVYSTGGFTSYGGSL